MATETTIVIRARDLTSRVFRGMTGRLDKMRRTVFNLKTGLLSLVATLGLFRLGRGFIQTGEQFEIFEAQLQTLLGTSKKAKQALAEIVEFAATTPFEVANLVETRVLLESVGIQGKDTMRILGDTAAAFGRDILDVGTAVISMEREVLRRFGIDVRREGNQAVFRWRNNMGEIVETVAEGGQDIQRETLFTIFNQRYAGSMALMQNKWKTMVSNLSDQWTDFKRLVTQSGVFDFLKAGVQLALDKIDDLKKKGQLKEFAQQTSDTIIRILTATVLGVAGIVDALTPISKRLLSFIKTVFEGFTSLPPVIQDIGLAGAILFGIKGKTAIILLSLAMDQVNKDIERIKKTGAATPAESVLAKLFGINQTLNQKLRVFSTRMDIATSNLGKFIEKAGGLKSFGMHERIEIAKQSVQEFNRVLRDLEAAVKQEKEINVSFDAGPALKEINRIRNVSLPDLQSRITIGGDPISIFKEVASEVKAVGVNLLGLEKAAKKPKTALIELGKDMGTTSTFVQELIDKINNAMKESARIATETGKTIKESFTDAFAPLRGGGNLSLPGDLVPQFAGAGAGFESRSVPEGFNLFKRPELVEQEPGFQLPSAALDVSRQGGRFGLPGDIGPQFTGAAGGTSQVPGLAPLSPGPEFENITGETLTEGLRTQLELTTELLEKNRELIGVWQEQFDTIDVLGGAHGNLARQMEMENKVMEFSNQFRNAATGAMKSFILGQEKLGPAMKRAAAQVLAGIAAEAAVMTLIALALGFYRLAQTFGVPNPGSVAAFAAAGQYAVVAGVAGVASRALAGSAGVGRGPVGSPGNPATTRDNSPSQTANAVRNQQARPQIIKIFLNGNFIDDIPAFTREQQDHIIELVGDTV